MNKKQKLVEPERNYKDYWDNKLKLGRKVELAMKSGWITKKGRLTKTGEKIAESRWDDLSPTAQNVLKGRIEGLYKQPSIR